MRYAVSIFATSATRFVSFAANLSIGKCQQTLHTLSSSSVWSCCQWFHRSWISNVFSFCILNRLNIDDDGTPCLQKILNRSRLLKLLSIRRMRPHRSSWSNSASASSYHLSNLALMERSLVLVSHSENSFATNQVLSRVPLVGTVRFRYSDLSIKWSAVVLASSVLKRQGATGSLLPDNARLKLSST
jgi:hypothetical protein